MTPDDLADIEMQRVATRRAESWDPRTDLELADRVLDLVEGRIYTDVDHRSRIDNSARTELEGFFRGLRREWGVS